MTTKRQPSLQFTASHHTGTHTDRHTYTCHWRSFLQVAFSPFSEKYFSMSYVSLSFHIYMIDAAFRATTTLPTPHNDHHHHQSTITTTTTTTAQYQTIRMKVVGADPVNWCARFALNLFSLSLFSSHSWLGACPLPLLLPFLPSRSTHHFPSHFNSTVLLIDPSCK